MHSIQIPESSGAILLPNTVTFPHGAIPLHIFEPRYRKMLNDALADNFMICVANLHSEETLNPADCTSKIGTIGFIRASHEQDDGCSNLILHSIIRVEFLSWKTNSRYPKAKIRPIPSITPPNSNSTKLLIESLRHATSHILSQFPPEAGTKINDSLDKVNEDIGTLTDVVAQQFVNHDKTRQALLEESNPHKRAETLTRYLRIQKNC